MSFPEVRSQVLRQCARHSLPESSWGKENDVGQRWRQKINCNCLGGHNAWLPVIMLRPSVFCGSSVNTNAPKVCKTAFGLGKQLLFEAGDFRRQEVNEFKEKLRKDTGSNVFVRGRSLPYSRAPCSEGGRCFRCGVLRDFSVMEQQPIGFFSEVSKKK